MDPPHSFVAEPLQTIGSVEKYKVEKVFFFIFMSSYPEMSFLGSQKEKKFLNMSKNFLFFK
jgi:hypothetical protein